MPADPAPLRELPSDDHWIFARAFLAKEVAADEKLSQLAKSPAVAAELRHSCSQYLISHLLSDLISC